MTITAKIKIPIFRLLKRRSKELCHLCPDNIRGTCCYHSVHLEEPSQSYCDTCPEHLREKCEYPKEDLPESGKKYAVILDKHPCKWLNRITKMCKVYERRFLTNRQCRTIKQGMAVGVWHSECIYVKKNKKYQKGIVKVWYKDIKDKLCPLAIMNYTLCNESPHRVIAKY